MKIVWGLIAAIIGAAVIYAGAMFFPVYVAHLQFAEDLQIHVRSLRASGRSVDQLGDALYRDAQRYNIPLKREDLKVEVDPTGTRISLVSADYDTPVDLYFFQPTVHWHTQYPKNPAADSAAKRGIVSAVGLVLGLYWFFKGFVIMRGYRIVADTPLTPIRSIAMGLVQIHGKAVSEKTLVSPVSSTPCYFYQVNIEKWEGGSDGSGMWSPHSTDAGWVPFYLADETGSVLVNPRGADCDLEHTARVQVAKSEGVAMGHAWKAEEPPADIPGMPKSPADLRRYIFRVESGMRTALFQGADLTKPALAGSQQKKSRARFSGWLIFLLRAFLVRRPGLIAAGAGPGPGDYRLTEQCVLPDATYDIVGTCMENRDAQTDSDRNVIAKGENSPTLLISHRDEKELEAALSARIRRHILGGGLLAIGSAAALLEALGYL